MFARLSPSTLGIMFVVVIMALGQVGSTFGPGAYAVSSAALREAPAISGEAAVVLDGNNGDILYDKHAHDWVPPASLTKTVTAIVAIEKARLTDRVHIDFDSFEMVVQSQSTVMGLKPGDEPSIEDLLYGLMLPSGNDAAVAIARYVGGTEQRFIDMMNEKVRGLGLKDTHFSNPHGLHATDHYSSAYDMAALSRYAMQNAAFARIAGSVRYPITGPRPYEVWNLNRLLYSYDGADGVKIGYTEEALETIVASARRSNYRLFVAVMRSNDRYGDSRRLLDYFFGALAEGTVERTPIPTPTATPSTTPSPTPTPPTLQRPEASAPQPGTPLSSAPSVVAANPSPPSSGAASPSAPSSGLEALLRGLLSLFGIR
ncbi:MAG: D-alanyl-D-alanine carboxypeptidase [Chloroflexi bacterium]|nr:D-alanyl-D-alanine carboxypeptidase [Chloroflexota bacterium]